MHRKVKGLLSFVITVAMVTATVAPASAEELSLEQQPAEQQPIVEMIEPETEAAEPDITEAEPVLVPVEAEPDATETQEAVPDAVEAEPASVPEQLIAETTEPETMPTEQNAAEAEPALTSGTSSDYLYDNLTADQKQFRVYSGADISSDLRFLEVGVSLDAEDLNALTGTILKKLMAGREGDLNFYRLSGWKLWSVDENGAPKSVEITSDSGLLGTIVTKTNFVQTANMVNNGTGTSPVVICQQPILEPVWSCLDYVIPVYDKDGNNTGTTITLNAQNYGSAVFPNVEADGWKLIYDGTEYRLNAASEIWTNETNGIRTIGKDSFTESKAILQPIVLQEGTAEFAQPDWQEGQPKPAPIVSSVTNGTENITYYYKEQGADDGTYTLIEPGKAGAYTAKAVFAATAEYQEVVKTADFNILPIQVILQEGTAEFAQPDWQEGQPKPAPIVSSVTNGTENITYYYKEQGADDGTYTLTEPVMAGAYTAKAVFAATAEYQEVVKTADFNILPIQVILQEGTAEFVQPDWQEGQPKPAPIVSSATNGTENITYYYKEAGADDSTYTTAEPDKVGNYTAKAVFAATELYLEVVKTADFKILPNVVADGAAPVISGVSDGQVYYGDQTVTITDENLKTVTVNGEAAVISGNRADITLKPSEEAYKIVAEDTAGNKIECSVEVWETWVRDGIKTNGKKSLRHARMYKLGSGQWTVDGDSTVYSGGGTFYVKNGGEYDFTKK